MKPFADKPMDAWSIALKLMRDRWFKNFVLPNYTPLGWWECDVFELTSAGYFREYEIKVSRADFKVDARKSWGSGNPTKHQRLALADVNGPSRFAFVVPKGMLDISEVPEWAGLIEASWWSIDPKDLWPTVSLNEVKKAPKLHGQPAGDRARNAARDTPYWRFHRQIDRRPRAGISAPPEHPEELE